MSPRRYRMGKRTARVQTTRLLIVDAAIRLHARHGTIATRWDDIAAEAAVSRATVYQHFPSLEDLIPACAQVAFELIEVPTPAQSAARVAGQALPIRLESFVRDSCRCYATGAEWLRVAWRERDLVPAMATAVGRLQEALDALLDAVLDGVTMDSGTRRIVRVMLDFPLWESFDRAGVPRDEIAERILRLAEFQIDNGRHTS